MGKFQVQKSPEERLWDGISKAPGQGPGGDCWEWQNHTIASGYGSLFVGGKNTLAHRFAYELASGSIPDGLFVCHRCDNRKCCNPAHLFLGTNSDNMLDMYRKGRHRAVRIHAAKTHCAKGHEFTPENTIHRVALYKTQHGPSRGPGRICRICKKEWDDRARIKQNNKKRNARMLSAAA